MLAPKFFTSGKTTTKDFSVNEKEVSTKYDMPDMADLKQIWQDLYWCPFDVKIYKLSQPRQVVTPTVITLQPQ